MMLRECAEIREKLVDYADRELAAEKAAVVAEHVGICQRCQETLAGLERSLELAQVVWEDQVEQLSEIKTAKVVRSRGSKRLRLAATAASILLVLTGALIWRAIQGSNKPEKPIVMAEAETQVVEKEITVAEIEEEMFRAGLAAELLAMADFIGAQPGGAEFARERYTYLAATYPETAGAAQAKIRLKKLNNRSIKNEID